MKQFSIFAFIALLGCTQVCLGGIIQDVTEGHIIFSSSGIPPGIGDLFVSLSENNKIAGIYKIESIGAEGIRAKILKGQAQLGEIVFRYKTEVGVLPEKKIVNRWRDFQWGIAAEGNYTQIDLSVFRSSTFDSRQYPVSLAGNSYGFMFFNQGPFYDLLNFRLLGGFQKFHLTTTIPFPDCDETTKCYLNVIYGTFGPRIQIDVLEQPAWRLWVAAGGNVLIPIKKESNIINTHDLNVNINYGASSGVDFSVADRKFLTAELEFMLFPNSTTGKARSVAIRAGYGVNY